MRIRKKPLSRHGLFAALLASVVLSAGGAAAQEQPGAAAQEQPGAAPAIEAPAPVPGQTAPDAAAPPATQPGVTTPTETGPSTATSLTLPRDLSPWGMFMAADIVVKAVMIGLAFASFVTWTIWLAKSLEILGGKLRARRAAQAIGNAGDVEPGRRARSAIIRVLARCWCGRPRKRSRFRPARSTMCPATG